MRKNMVYCIIFSMLLVFLPSLTIKADSTGYYYENIDVEVEVNSKREFKITETLDVYYEEEMHGIIRSIPEESDAEGYKIKDIHVEGAPYQIEETYSGVEIRIGDADKTVSGKKRYVLTYTLAHYQDYDENYDYIYLNLIGDDFDSPTCHLSAHIVWPNHATVENVTLRDGYYGSKENKKLDYTMGENEIFIESNQTIEPYEAATVQIQLNQGAFADAPAYVYPYIVHQKTIQINIDEAQDFHVTQIIQLTANEDDVSYPLSPDFDAFYSSETELYDFECLVNRVKKSSEYYAHLDEAGEYTIEMKYLLHPKIIADGELKLSLLDYYEDAQTENVHVEITMPVLSDYRVFIGRWNDDTGSQRYEVTQNDHTLTLITRDVLQPEEKLELSLYLSAADFYRPTPPAVNVIPMIGVILVMIAAFIRYVVFRPRFVEPVSFYPPRSMNSAEAGYVIDGRLSNEDMTSLIFYWAGLGALQIKGIDGEFTLIKVNELPGHCPSYERKLFDSMFEHGHDHEVTSDDLKGRFYVDINRARKKIIEKYKEMPMYEKMGNGIKLLIYIAALLLFLTMIAVLSMAESKEWVSECIIKIISLSPAMIFMILMLLISRLFEHKDRIISKIFYYLFLFMPIGMFYLIISVVTEIYQTQLMVTAFECIFAFLIAREIKKYSPQALALIGELKGFKRFIKEAQKDQLERLLEEDPEYYYHILPYAQALHVTKIWQDKFSELAMEPPSYQTGDIMTYATFNSFAHTLTRSMSSSMSSPSSSSSDGGGYSGGGGGFSGGGSSGGGSGGGGSRGW